VQNTRRRERDQLMWFNEWDNLNLFNNTVSTATVVPSERMLGDSVRAAS